MKLKSNIPKLRFSLGLYFTLMAIVFYTFRDIIAKSFVELPSIEIVFFTSFFGLILLYISSKKKSIEKIKITGKEYEKKAKKILIFRGVMGFLATTTFFYNIMNMPFVNTVVFMQSTVIFSSVLMYVFFRERLSTLQWFAIFVSFIGVLCIVQPDGISIDKLNAIGLLCGLTSAIAYMSVRELRRYYEPRIIVFSFLVCNIIGSSLCMIIAQFIDIPKMDFLFQKFVMPDSFFMFLLLFLIALFSTISQLYKTKAYASAKTGVVGVIWYLRVPIALLLGVALGDSWPEWIVFIGIILVTLSSVMVSYISKDKNSIDRYWEKEELTPQILKAKRKTRSYGRD